MVTVDADVVHAWLDPEFWPAKGLGCSHCHERPPIVIGLAFGALCDECLLRCFPGWDFERVAGWLVVQKQTYIRQEARRAALEAWRERQDDSLWIQYQRDYEPVEWWS